MAVPDTSHDGLTNTNRAEHNSDAKAKQTAIRGLDPDGGIYYNASIRPAGSYPSLNVAIVDGSGNQVTSFGGSGGTSATDDSAFTAASGSGTPIMGFATSDSVDSGDVGVLAMDTARNLKVSIEADNVGIGGGTQYAVDAALGATPTGTLSLGIRDDALSALTPVEGDAIGLRVDSTGALWVATDDTITVDGSGVTQPVSNAGLTELAAAINSSQLDINIATDTAGVGSTQYAEDTAHNTGDTGNLILAVRDDSPASNTSADGDYEALRTDKNGALWTRDINSEIVLFDDDFSDAVNPAWNLTVTNGGALALTSSSYEFMTGGQALKLSSGTSAQTELHRFMYWPPGINYVSWEVIFASMGENASNFGFYLSYRDATNWIRGRTLHTNSTNVWAYMDSAGANQTLLTRDTSESNTFARWHRVYMEIDITNDTYKSIQIDDQDFTSTVDGLALRTSADTAVPQMLDFAVETTNTGSSSDLIFDRMVAKAWR